MSDIRILLTGVGGQGNLLASRLLGEAAVEAGVPCRLSETHGMAQRGGVVESTVVLGEVESPVISAGQADLVVAFEPLEALRALTYANKDTVVITSTATLPPFTVSMGQSTYPETEDIIEKLKAKVGRVIAFDAMEKALEADNPLAVNMVLLGALVEAVDLPLSKDQVVDAIKTKTKPAFVDANLKAFELGAAQAA